MAKFSYESMLKQEEALAELDASIDEWATKLHIAENRRTRVRQKLLEHVAAAAIMSVAASKPSQGDASQEITPAPGPQGVHNISTPPRSPTMPAALSRTGSCSPSPQRVVAQVPSTILEHPIVEEVESLSDQVSRGLDSLRRADVESIRIYAGDDITALLADVEKQITRISADITLAANTVPEAERRKLHRAQSHEVLSGLRDRAQNQDILGGLRDRRMSDAYRIRHNEATTRNSDLDIPPPPPLKD